MDRTAWSSDEVLVQVLSVKGGREIGGGLPRVTAFATRIDDVKEAILAAAHAVAGSLDGLPSASGWHLDAVSAKFGISLTAEGGVILTKATAGTTFDVTVNFERDDVRE